MVPGPLSICTLHDADSRSLMRSEILFPPMFRIAAYLQKLFDGPANETCAWHAVSTRDANVHQCSATTISSRPPERILNHNDTFLHMSDMLP